MTLDTPDYHCAAPKLASASLNPVIEGYRGLAAMFVLIHHYSYQLLDSFAWLHFFHNGVDLFFVITGFLFAPYLLRDTILNPLEFLVRRAFRIYPLYIISLFLISSSLWGEKTGILLALLKHLFFFQTWPGSSLAEAGFFSLIYWTLPVEVAFYLFIAIVLGVYLYGTFRFQQLTKRILTLSNMGVLSVILFLAVCYWERADLSEEWVIRQAQLPALLIEFWLGILLYAAWPTIKLIRFIVPGLFAAGVILLVMLSMYYSGATLHSLTPRPFGLFNVLSALAYALLLGAGLIQYERKGLRPRIMMLFLWGGQLSFGIYLFHEWVLGRATYFLGNVAPIVTVVVAFTAVVLLASVLNRYVEVPARNFGRRLGAGR